MLIAKVFHLTAGFAATTHSYLFFNFFYLKFNHILHQRCLERMTPPWPIWPLGLGFLGSPIALVVTYCNLATLSVTHRATRTNRSNHNHNHQSTG